MKIKMRYNIILFFLFILATSMSLTAQSVGINTTSPNGLLHIDSKGDNVSALYTDDVVINTLGNLTIGTNIGSNSAKVSVNGSVIFNTTTIKEVGYALTSDNDGYASWSMIVGASGIFEDRIQIGSITANTTISTWSYVDLPNSEYEIQKTGFYNFDLST